MPRRLTESDRREATRWPEYRLDIPATVVLACPRCGARVQCDVDLIDNETPRYAVAGIPTWRCEDCGKLMCAGCKKHRHPADRDLYQCDTCRADAVAAVEAL
jgi:predicted RNA-binding Zn-ribbon protein involved in translation (DUF1610 family)